MLDQNWKTWVLIVIAAVGLTFEALKHLPVKESAAWDSENLKWGTTKPYSVRTLPKNLTAKYPHAQKVAGNSAVLKAALNQYIATHTPTGTEFEHKKEVTELGKKKKSDEEWEEVIDPKTGKKVRRKKKKVAKKEEKKVEVAKVEVPPPPPPPKDEIGSVLDEAVAYGAIAPVAKSNKSPFGTLEEWTRRLLNRPDLAETRHFIQQFQQNLVTPDVYYKISELMITDSRPEMKQLGLLCLGVAPSVTSFQLIARLEKSEKPGSKLRLQADAFLSRYSEPNHLGTLAKVMAGGDSYSQILATQRLDAAIQRSLATKNTPPANSPGTPVAPTAQATATANATAARYRPFVSVLRGLSQAKDPALTEQARITLSNLDLLLNNPSTNVASTRTP